jgi:hypothetical protein
MWHIPYERTLNAKSSSSPSSDWHCITATRPASSDVLIHTVAVERKLSSSLSYVTIGSASYARTNTERLGFR